MKDEKLTVLDPRGQPSGVFGRRGEPGSHMMAIFNPATQPTMTVDELVQLRMAPRLDSLDNKTIYLVNTGFAGSQEFFEEVQDWFGRNMPSVKTVLHTKKGNMFADEPELWVELKEKADGVVFGVGGWDGCSASIADFARTMEGDYGVPTAPIVTSRFAGYVLKDGRHHGMNLRWTFPPYPVGWVPRETLHDYVQGNDPITGVPLMQEIVNALTEPLTDAEKNPVIYRKPERPRLLEPDTESNLQRFFLENAWTDGLPIVLPTEERVAEMLTGTDHDPQEVVGMMTVAPYEEKNEYTVEKVAVNAVMAGARPEHLPVILAIASARHASILSSTGSYGSMVVVNGPVRNIIGMNCGGGAMGPFNYSNSVIGRAWTLMSINFGDARPGDNFWATIGNGNSFANQCCGENEERSVWEPFHVRNGFKPGESAVSVFRGWNVMTLGIGAADGLLERIKSFRGMAYTFVLDPLVAKSLKNDGYENPRKLSEWLVKQADSPFLRPEDINFLVVGGETNPIFQTTDYVYYRTESVDKWIPKGGIKLDEQPLRMPVGLPPADGACGIE